MTQEFYIFAISMFLVVKGSTLATKHAALLAEEFRLSKYVVGFIIVAVISILPETLISFNAVIEGEPSFALGMLFGSNVADLTLIFAIIIFVAGRNLKMENKILKNRLIYPFLLLLPVLLAGDGFLSRLEGVVLVIIGIVFYITALKDGVDESLPFHNGIGKYKHFLHLLLGIVLLLLGAHFTVTSATSIAHMLHVSPILIGMLIVGLGTTMPELFFSIQCVKKNDDSLAVGDLLGTVLADATIVVGILALISPFHFPLTIVYVTGFFMVSAAFLLFYCMYSGKILTRREAGGLLIFWILFVVIEFIIGTNLIGKF